MSKEQAKIVAYQTALDQIIKDLTAKRTEMATLAKKTLADFEVKIPLLTKEEAKLTNRIADLNLVIKEKQALHDEKKDDLEAKYQKLNVQLDTAHAENVKALVDREKAFTAKELKYKETLKQDKQELKNREELLASNQALLNKDKDQLIIDESNLARRWDEYNRNILSFKSEQEEGRSTIALQKDDLTIRRKDLSQREKDFMDKEKKADELLLRLNEIDSKERSFTAREVALTKEKEGLHQLIIKNMADQTKMNRRKADLDSFESFLNDRENNLKQAEAEMVKK